VSRPRHAFGAQPGRLPATLLRALCAELSDPARYRRAKDYARDGAVIDLDVRPGAVVGEVLGSRRSPYRVTIAADPVDDAAAATSPVMLLPERTELAVACTCPDADSGAMCKHALALLLVFADEVSIEPELLVRWRASGGSAAAGTVRLRGRGATASRPRSDPARDRDRSSAPASVDVLAPLLASPTPIGALGPMTPLPPEALLTPPARADAMSALLDRVLADAIATIRRTR